MNQGYYATLVRKCNQQLTVRLIISSMVTVCSIVAGIISPTYLGFLIIPVIVTLLIDGLALRSFIANKKSCTLLETYGGIPDTESVYSQRFEAEVFDGKYFVTKDWILSINKWDLYLLPLSDLVWMYETDVRTDLMLTSSHLDLWFSHSKTRKMVVLRRDNLNEAAAAIAERAPCAFVGFSYDYQRKYQSGEMLRAWEERKMQAVLDTMVAEAPPGQNWSPRQERTPERAKDAKPETARRTATFDSRAVDSIECPFCHKKQMTNRDTCYSCGAEFLYKETI